MVEVYAANTQGRRRCSVAEVFKVTREGDAFGAHRALGNRKLLWHGTSIAVVAAILKVGLRIMLYDTPRVPVYMTRLECSSSRRSSRRACASCYMTRLECLYTGHA